MTEPTRGVEGLTKKRYARERRLRAMGFGALAIAVGLLLLLLGSVVVQGYAAFWQSYVRLEISFDDQVIDEDDLRGSNYAKLVSASLYERFPEVSDRRGKKALRGLISTGAALQLRDMVMDDPSIIGSTEEVWLLASDDVDQFIKGKIDRTLDEADRRIKDDELAWLDVLGDAGEIERRFNTVLFTSGDSREPELAGIWGAIVGSFYMMLVTLLLSTPVGVAAAVYLEEFAAKNRLTDLIEVNVNNLAAVPSIVFGLLGLAVFLQVFHLPRSAPIVGGLTLSLMTLPTIVVATRAALRAVPPSIREAALGMGASHVQSVAHHVLPLALPGIMTGTIIGMARALGETAPLLMIGMVAFIVDIPSSLDGPSDRSARADLSLVRQSGTCIHRENGRGHHRAAGVPGAHECAGGVHPQKVRKTMVAMALVTEDIPPTPETPVVPKMSAENVNLWYADKQALFDVSLDIAAKEVTALIGPSGCGKSTFLRCLNRMNDTIDICRIEGDIRLDGNDIYDKAIDVVQLRSHVGMVFQKPNPFPKSIYDNVAYGPRIHGLAASKADLDQIVETALRGAGLWKEVSDRLDHQATGLSGGQQQRLCIARAIAVSPEVILMDEPCSALDPIATAHIEELIDELRETFTIAIVTHNMQQAARVSQTTAFFHLGKLIELGATENVFTAPREQMTQDYITGRFG